MLTNIEKKLRTDTSGTEINRVRLWSSTVGTCVCPAVPPTMTYSHYFVGNEAISNRMSTEQQEAFSTAAAC